jgi:hypothetical protein
MILFPTAALFGLLYCLGSQEPTNSVPVIVPPAMPKRTIAPPAQPPSGETIPLSNGDCKVTLFVPKAFDCPAAKDVSLTIHFHGVAWFAIDEHLRHGLAEPLLVVSLGEGSTVYRKAFEDRARLARLIALVEKEIRRLGASEKAVVTRLRLSSFSAGYGAVREIVKSEAYLKIIQRIVLADSLYASYESVPAGTEPMQPAKEHIEPWLPYLRAAARGEKEFVLTHSQVPTTGYANSALCAKALVEAMGGRNETVSVGTLDAARDPLFPLLTRCDIQGFHVWGYGGTDAQAHMTHARHIAEVWQALDVVKQARQHP